MVEPVGRRGVSVSEVDVDRVPLPRPDPLAGFIELEPALVVLLDHSRQGRAVEAHAMPGGGGDEVIDCRPPGSVDGEADARRVVTQAQ